MGGVQSSRICPRPKLRRHKSIHSHSANDNILVSFIANKIKVVNARTSDLSLLSLVITKHCKILQEGLDNLTYSYCLPGLDQSSMIHLMASILLALYKLGLEPMTSIDIGQKKRENTLQGPHTMVYFKKRDGMRRKESFGSQCSVYSRSKSIDNSVQTWLGLETSYPHMLRLHNMSNSVLLSLVTCLHSDNMLHGVSRGVASVIRDYTDKMPNITRHKTGDLTDKIIEFHKSFSSLPECVETCLASEGYSTSMEVQINSESRISFFVKNSVVP